MPSPCLPTFHIKGWSSGCQPVGVTTRLPPTVAGTTSWLPELLLLLLLVPTLWQRVPACRGCRKLGPNALPLPLHAKAAPSSAAEAQQVCNVRLLLLLLLLLLPLQGQLLLPVPHAAGGSDSERATELEEQGAALQCPWTIPSVLWSLRSALRVGVCAGWQTERAVAAGLNGGLWAGAKTTNPFQGAKITSYLIKQSRAANKWTGSFQADVPTRTRVAVGLLPLLQPVLHDPWLLPITNSMDFVDRLSNLAGASATRAHAAPQKLFDFTNLSPAVRSHLAAGSGPPCCLPGQRASGGGGAAGPEGTASHSRPHSLPAPRGLAAESPEASSSHPAPMQVYLTLAVALCLSAAGVYVSAVTGFAQGLGILGFLVSVPWMMSVPSVPATLGKRRVLFGTAALSQGLLVAPLVRATLALHPGVLFTAFAGTAGAQQGLGFRVA